MEHADGSIKSWVRQHTRTSLSPSPTLSPSPFSFPSTCLGILTFFFRAPCFCGLAFSSKAVLIALMTMADGAWFHVSTISRPSHGPLAHNITHVDSNQLPPTTLSIIPTTHAHTHSLAHVPAHTVQALYDYGPRGVRCPLVFLPPATGTADVFYKQIIALGSAGFRVLSVDYPIYW